MAPRLIASTSLLLVLLLGWAVWTRTTAPSDATVVRLSDSLWHQERISVAVVQAPGGPLRAGDTVTGVRAMDGGYVYDLIRDGDQRSVVVQLIRPAPATTLRYTWGALLSGVLLLAMGWFVFWRRPRDPAAQSLLSVASLFSFGVTMWLMGDQAGRLALHGPRLVDVLGELALALVWGAAAHFAVVMPGTTLRPGGRLVALMYASPLLLHGVVLAYALPTAHGRLEVLGRVAQVSLVPMVVMPVVTCALMTWSYRRTPTGQARRRLRWIVIMFAVSAVAALGLWVLPMLWGHPLLDPVLLPTVVLLPAAAFSAAVLRYRLFDIEVIVRRSLLAGSLTACVLVVYLAVGWVIGLLTGAGGTGLAAIVSTCLVAFGIQPLSARLRLRIGRLVYGSRDDPFVVVSRLGHIDVAAAPQDVLGEVAEALGQALRLRYVGIELRTRTGVLAAAADFGVSVGTPLIIELEQSGETVGRLVMDVGSGQEPFGPADQRLLRLLTRRLGAAAAIVLLNAQLRESRRRLVQAREEERRRIYRTLRGGLERELAAAGRQVVKGRELIAMDPVATTAVLDETIGGIRAVIGEIRILVSGLRPPALDQLGLAGAIQERVRRLADEAGGTAASHLEVIQENDLGQLPAAVEVAAFWIAVEVAQRAAPTGDGWRFRAVLARRGDLILNISHGGGVTSDSTLDGVTERVEELGGTITMSTTAVRSRLPIREEVTG